MYLPNMPLCTIGLFGFPHFVKLGDVALPTPVIISTLPMIKNKHFCHSLKDYKYGVVTFFSYQWIDLGRVCFLCQWTMRKYRNRALFVKGTAQYR